MSNCISLISCDGSCKNIHNIQSPYVSLLTPFVDTLVQINDDTDCTYYVREPKLVGFVIDSPSFLCSTRFGQDNLIDYGSVQYQVNSIIYNGVEYVNSPITYTISTGDFQCLICDSPEGAFCQDTISGPFGNSTAHPIKLNTIFNQLNIDIEVFPFGNDGATTFRLFNSDSLQIVIERIGTNLPGSYTMLYNNSGLVVEFEGGELTSYLIEESVYTCTTSKIGKKIATVTGVSSCQQVDTFPEYVPVSECDVITIFPMGVTCAITNTIGKTGATRTATLVVTGGTPPYSFEWENGNRTDTISNLPAGTYNAVVRDYWGDYVINTSCELPPINCENANIVTTLSYTCKSNGATLDGIAVLNIVTTGGFPPYTYSGSVNNITTAITNNMLVYHGDFINVETTDANGCTSNVIAAININCPPSSPLPPPPPSCDVQVVCPNGNLFTLDVSATTSFPLYTLKFKLSSSNYTGTIRGSYKIYGVDFPNSFLNLGDTVTSTPITWTSYTKESSLGSPVVELSDYIEFGFTQFTPTNPIATDDVWETSFIFNTQGLPFYTSPINGVFWTPGVTNIYIDISLYDSDFCVHKSVPLANFVTLPLDLAAPNTLTINFS
jgi:hypothetical protein